MNIIPLQSFSWCYIVFSRTPRRHNKLQHVLIAKKIYIFKIHWGMYKKIIGWIMMYDRKIFEISTLIFILSIFISIELEIHLGSQKWQVGWYFGVDIRILFYGCCIWWLNVDFFIAISKGDRLEIVVKSIGTISISYFANFRVWFKTLWALDFTTWCIYY